MKRMMTILLLAALLLASCGNAQTGETTADPAETAAAQTETETESPLDKLPAGDFGGADYHMLGDVNSNWWIISLYSEEMTGEIINDTVYERNHYVEDLYNVTISHTETKQAGNDIKASVQSGTDEYDVVWERLNQLITPAQSGQLYNLYDYDGFAFDAPWWDNDSVDALTINGKVFFACNDINVHTMEGCSAMYFSKTLADINGLESPYT